MSMERKYVLGERLAFKFSALTYPKKNSIGPQESWGKFLRLCLDFCEWKGRKNEPVRGARRRKKDRKSANGCSCRALSATRIERGFFSLWTLCGLGSQLYWNTILVPADTDNDGFKPPRFHCRVFFASGSKYHSTGSAQTKGSLLHPCQGSKPTWILLRGAPLDCRSYPYHVLCALKHCNQDRCCSLHPDRQEAEEKAHWPKHRSGVL